MNVIIFLGLSFLIALCLIENTYIKQIEIKIDGTLEWKMKSVPRYKAIYLVRKNNNTHFVTIAEAIEIKMRNSQITT